jgi:chaperone BCS1
MDTSNGTTFFAIQPTPSHQISIVDIFLPGFGTIFSSMQHLLAGNLDIYVRLLGICGMLIFLGRYGFRYLTEFVETYLSS